MNYVADHDKLIEVCDAWLQSLRVGIWPSLSIDTTDDDERLLGAAWLALQLERIDVFAQTYKWKEDEDDEDRVRSSAESDEDSDGDSHHALLQWR